MAEPVSTAVAIGIATNLAYDAAAWLVAEAQDSDLVQEVNRRIGNGEVHPKAQSVFNQAIRRASRGLPHLDDSTVEDFFDVPENKEIVSRWIWDPERADSEIDDLDLTSATSKQESANLKHFVDRLPDAIERIGQEVFDDEAWLIIWNVAEAFDKVRERIEEIQPSSDPAPLSSDPPDPIVPHLPVGRQADLEWLRNTNGDRLLVGQPGSGKTLLLYRLTKDGALFAVSDDRGDIAEDLQEKNPGEVIVDDATFKIELIEKLRQLRKEVETDFDVVASCWPGGTHRLKDDLSIGNSQVRKLNDLTRDEIVEVIRLTGLEGPTPLVRQIVNQANGRPGLAVTLTRLCLNGDIREVVLGNRIADSILSTFERITGDKTKYVLGILALAGKRGFEVQSVAGLTGLNRLEVSQMLEQLAVGGVLTEVQLPDPTGRNQGMAVQPPALRHALIRDVFFTGPSPLDYKQVVRKAPSKHSATRALIGTRARGGSVPRDFLQKAVEHLDRRNLWQNYAAAGREEAQWILKEHSDKTVAVAEQALSSAPRQTLKTLLKQSVGDDRPLPQTSEHPLRKVKEWVISGRPGTELAVRRRRLLFDLAQRWLSNGNDRLTGLRAIRYALAPQYEDRTLDPGSEHSLTLSHGTLTEGEIEEIAPLWSELWEEIDEDVLEEWSPILELLRDWWSPQRYWGAIPDDLWQVIHDHAEEQLKIAVARAASHPGILRRLSRMATEAGVEIDTTSIDAFEVLYPKQHPDTPTVYRERHAEEVKKLADQWESRPPDEVAQEVYRIWRQSEVAGLHLKSPRTICRALASRVDSPLKWNRTFREVGLPSHLAKPFLNATARTDREDARSQLFQQIHRQIEESPERSGPQLEVALREAPRNSDLYDLALQHLDGHVSAAKTLVLRDELNTDKINDLLNHGNDQIAKSVAEALWQSGQTDSSLLEAIPSELHEPWREAVIHRVGDAPWLKRAFEEDAQLAEEWAKARIREGDSFQFRNFSVHDTEEAAIEMLNDEVRKTLLTELVGLAEESRKLGTRWARAIIGDNLELYQCLLEKDVEEALHLCPLVGRPDQTWIEKADLALGAGYSPEKVAEAALNAKEATPTGFVAEESLSDEWKEWADSFRFLSTDNSEIQRALDHGAHLAEQLAEQAYEPEP